MCQLGGSNPKTLAAAAKVVAKYGYDEINLNCGCPSERVAGAGCFGAAMMLQPQLVAQCCQAMQEAVPHIPITVKCRLGKCCAWSTAVLWHIPRLYVYTSGVHVKSLSKADLMSVSGTACDTSCITPGCMVSASTARHELTTLLQLHIGRLLPLNVPDPRARHSFHERLNE